VRNVLGLYRSPEAGECIVTLMCYMGSDVVVPGDDDGGRA